MHDPAPRPCCDVGQGFKNTTLLQIEYRDGTLGLALGQERASGENLPFEIHLLLDQRPVSGNWAALTGFTESAVSGSLSFRTILPMVLVEGS